MKISRPGEIYRKGHNYKLIKGGVGKQKLWVGNRDP